MATTKEQLAEVMAVMPGVGDVTARAMMGEYVLYYRGKVFGGLYDGRLLIKPVPAARAMLPQAAEEIPYPGAKPMLRLDTPDTVVLAELLDAMYDQLPAKKK